ncbi:MAG: hypothetical protein GC168_14500 [Candidatus Hydrogenedens sp.]|nr:hypothetical protein [Candidatus Hydrogenedens sp.]
MDICVIANPVAGGGKARRRARSLQRRLQRLGHRVELCVTKAAGDAERFARERAGSAIGCFVSVGGDGTANEMMNGLRGTTPVFTVLGVGTANVVARQFRIPRSPHAVAKMIHHANTYTMDLGERDGRLFLLGAGAGLDAAITTEVKKRRGRTSSIWIWVWPVIKTVLTYRYPKVRVIADGEVISESAEYAIVGNCIYSAGVFPSTPQADTADGLLDICLLHALTPWKCMALALTVWWPSFINRPDVTYRQARTVTFEPAGDEAAPLQIDGDPAGGVPAHFTVVPGAARIVIP